MPRLTEARKELRREQIVRAARRCFVRAGMERTSVADITAESGLSAGSIYAHFATKADIVHAVIQDLLDRRRETLSAYAAASERPPSPAEMIGHLSTAVDPNEAHIALQAWGQATTDPAVREIVVGMLERLREVFRIGCEEWLIRTQGHTLADAGPRARHLAGRLLAAYQALLFRSALLGEADVADLVDTVIPRQGEPS
ncbi:TetR/AcrR family transcriptional regulator [Asanoa siamensis]|uniref:HTH tetR-type domain-containing protein n=1 Tax=Asanoa siamensis TaxID=926357 RepID=A0ABQ4CZU6_9ACTN|nr:TetR/AcrR family transcriptional regulator [Asanoa siamensis]GIF76508.1 hypothetical protein Asi02nite_60260 [Asanoa siamensis]